MDNLAIAEIKKLCGKYGIGMPELSFHINVVSIRIYEILNGKRRVTVDTDLRLCKFFKLKPRHFIDMQIDYDVKIAEVELEDKLNSIKNIDEIVKKS